MTDHTPRSASLERGTQLPAGARRAASCTAALVQAMLAIAVLASSAGASHAQGQSKPAGKPVAEAKSTPSGAAPALNLTKTPLPFDEEVPPAGADNLMFSDAEIRYCLAQIIRIEAVRPLVDRYERAQVGYFNELVADYNSRCGHYRYMEGARESAQVQVEVSRSTIESDARQAYVWRFAESEKSSPPTRSPAAAQTPAKEAKKPPKPAAAAQAEAAASQSARSPQPKQPAATPARTEPAQTAAAAQTQAKQQPSEPPPAAPAAASQPERPTAPATPPPPQQQAAAIPSESVQPAGAQPQAKTQASEPPASTPSPNPQPERLATPAPQTAVQQAPAAIASAQDTRITEPSSPARAVDQTAPPAPASDTSSQASQPVASAAQVQGKPQTRSSPAAAPVSSENDRPRDAAPAQETKPPTAVAKASTDGAPAGAIDRFTKEIERAGSQVLDERDYPSEARDKKWQGTTLIEVRYAEGGYIRSIVVGRSCGHAVLDEQAVQIARNLRLPNAPEELRSHEFAVRFPIVFQLSNP